MKKSKFFLFLLVSLWSCLTVPIAHASSDESGLNYSVQKIKPEGQLVSDASSFYDLLVKPVETRRIQATIHNSSSTPIVVNSTIFTSFTNQNGQMTYTSGTDHYDSSLKFKLSDFSQIAASDVQAEIEPDTSQVVSVDIAVPETIPDGAYVGSWYFEKANQETTSTDDEGISISNKYSYAIGIKLTVNQEVATPNLNLIDITTGLQDYRKVVKANIQNDQPAVMSKLLIEAKVMKKDQYEVLYSNTIEGITMAPQSNYGFPIYFDAQPMEAGQYTMEISAKTEDPKWAGEQWRWRENFTITENEVQSLTEDAINDPIIIEDSFNWPFYLAIAGCILLLLLISLVFIWRRRRQEKQNQIMLQNKKRRRKTQGKRKVSHP